MNYLAAVTALTEASKAFDNASPSTLNYYAEKACEIIGRITPQVGDEEELEKRKNSVINSIDLVLDREVERAKSSDMTGKSPSQKTRTKLDEAQSDLNRAISKLQAPVRRLIEWLESK
ncbi:MAG: hypothetical protein ACRYFX_09775 [Janthinobacterium lividum]